MQLVERPSSTQSARPIRSSSGRLHIAARTMLSTRYFCLTSHWIKFQLETMPRNTVVQSLTFRRRGSAFVTGNRHGALSPTKQVQPTSLTTAGRSQEYETIHEAEGKKIAERWSAILELARKTVSK